MICLGVGVAALFFGIHPLRVESVAWATERRDVLSGFFYLTTVLCYLEAATTTLSARRRWLAVSIVAYICSLLSKASGITLPAVLIVLDVFVLRRLKGSPANWFSSEMRQVWLEKALFMLPAGAFAVVALFAQHNAGALRAIERYGVLERMMQAFYGVGFYTWKTLWPFGLSPLYELAPTFDPFSIKYLISALLVLGMTATLLAVRRIWPAGLAVWIVYLATIAPVLGLVQSGAQEVADRYSYLSCMGFAILTGAGLVWLRRNARGVFFRAGAAASCLVLIILGGLTWRQAQIWHDSESLWRHAISVNPRQRVPHHSLGVFLRDQGRTTEAIDHFRQALRIYPRYVAALNNLGVALASQGKLDEAIVYYRQALDIDPKKVEAHTNWGNALLKRGQFAEAKEQYQRAIAIDPKYVDGHYSIGYAMATRLDYPGAIRQFHQALGINPAHVDSHNGLGFALAATGDLEAATLSFTRSLALNPSQPEIHFSLGNLLATKGQLSEAAFHFDKAIQLKPDFVLAYQNLGRVFAAQGQMNQAVEVFQAAVQIDPNNAAFQETLALALAELGKKDEAERHFRESLRLRKSQNQSQPTQ